MEFRKMVTITLYARQQKRHRCIEQSFGLCGRGRGWDDLGEWHWNMYNIIYETSHQSRFDARYWMLGAGVLGKEFACNAGDLGSIPGWEDPLEKGMGTHSSILAWRIPWTEEPGGLQPMGSQRVRHNWVTNTFNFKKEKPCLCWFICRITLARDWAG